MFFFCSAFHKDPLILSASFGEGFIYTLYPVLLVVLFWLTFLSVSLFLVCFSGVATCPSLWQGDFTHSHKQVVNSLSTLLFHWWSEIPSRGGVHGDSPYEKLSALQKFHLSVFSECCFLELSARPSSIRTLLLSVFVVLFSNL